MNDSVDESTSYGAFPSALTEALLDDKEWNRLARRIAPRIGRLVIAFNDLEDTVNTAIVDFIDNDEEAWVFIAGMTYSQKVEALGKLFAMHLRYAKDRDEQKQQLPELLMRLKEANEKRNLHVHANWSGISAKSYVRVKTKVKPEGSKHIYRFLTPELIEEDITFIKEVSADLDEFKDYAY